MKLKKSDVYSQDALTLIGELNMVLESIIGNNGAKHVNFSDFLKPGAVFYVGYENEMPVCCAGIRRFDEHTGEVKRVYARRNTAGYATQLMKKLEAWAVAEGYQSLILECREKNTHAIEFYKRIGYSICPRFAPYENQEDAICFKKKLL